MFTNVLLSLRESSADIMCVSRAIICQLVLCEYPDCVKNIQEVNERVYALLGIQ